jgi:hypothetical protein
MTRRQNRIGEWIALLPDGDTEPSIVGDTQAQLDSSALISHA